MATPHINANDGDFAPAVLMPGDPRRAQHIAELLMPDAKLVTDVRGMLGFTGTCNGKPLSVMGSGMGQPSLTIYATELVKFYGVKRIIRVGTCGAIDDKVSVGDTVVALGAHTDSNMNQARVPGIHFSAVASWPLLEAAMREAEEHYQPEMGKVHVGTVCSEDHFYFKPEGFLDSLRAYHTLALEMETAALYALAAEFDIEALTVLTVSDHLYKEGTDMTAEERQTHFQGALRLATAAALS